MNLKPVNMIVAYDRSKIIGHGLNMPGWHISDDFKLNFVPKTKGCPVIMGANTARGFGKPLPNRTNICLSRQDMPFLPEGFVPVKNLWEALDIAQKSPGDIIWIIGGAQIYNLALKHVTIDELHITLVDWDFPAQNPNDEIRFPFWDVNKFTCDPEKTLHFKHRDPVDDPDPKKKDKGNSHSFSIKIFKGI